MDEERSNNPSTGEARCEAAFRELLDALEDGWDDNATLEQIGRIEDAITDAREARVKELQERTAPESSRQPPPNEIITEDTQRPRQERVNPAGDTLLLDDQVPPAPTSGEDTQARCRKLEKALRQFVDAASEIRAKAPPEVLRRFYASFSDANAALKGTPDPPSPEGERSEKWVVTKHVDGGYNLIAHQGNHGPPRGGDRLVRAAALEREQEKSAYWKSRAEEK